MSFFGNLSTLFNAKEPGKKSGTLASRPQTGPQAHQAAKTDPKDFRPAKKAITPQPTPQRQAPQAHPVQMPTKVVPTEDTIKAQESLLREAQARAREIIVEAKDEALAIRTKAEQEARDMRRQLEDQQRSIDMKLDKIESRLSQMDDRDKQLDKARQDLLDQRKQLEQAKQQVIEKLEAVSGMTHDEAKGALFENLEKKLAKEMATLIRQKEEEAKNEADEKVKEILIDAMKHGATDYVAEYTVSVVQLATEEDKSRIIGKAGRNIRTFERVTGVDVDLDVSPTEVRLSCFDPVRREIARVSLERLVKDGRIQPSRIEEVVKKVATELDRIMFEEGKKLCQAIGVYNLPAELVQMLGRFKYRFSYGQNLIAHTLEETRIGIKLAQELGLDVNTVKLGCLLHDIGKVSEETEGSHVELGVKIAKKYGMPQSVVDCIEQHHEDVPFSSPESTVVYIADAISGARPGARYENYEEYVKRLEKLETIATSYPEVDHAFAIQAGREVRVILVPEKSKDEDVQVLAMKIRDRVKNEMTYPGTVTVTVIRETRGQHVAA
jgi:ribonuclease Y